MTLICADSIVPENLPPTCDAYLAYVDGHWPTATRVRAMFPHAHLLTLTVLGGQAVADGCDVETGDLTPASGAVWVLDRMAAGAVRPVVYASAGNMSGVLASLAARGVGRGKVRLLSAHYGEGPHICGPDTCKAMAVDADGTQYTNSAAGVGGTRIDLSLLDDDFFGGIAPVTVEVDVTLEQLQNGSTGQPVQNWQGILVAHALGFMIENPAGKNVMERAGVDGHFGPATEAATRRFQAEAGLPQTGVVDAATWQKALG